MASRLVIAPAVADALAQKRPVVALETTVITHGLPEGQGVRTALDMESAVAESGDVSSDLTALARHPVAVVCAGAKAVLDLPRTLEMLETLGVPVYGFRTADLPAFYRRSSGLKLDQRFDMPEELANAVRVHWGMGAATGVVVANPVPGEYEMPAEIYQGSLEQALKEASIKGV